MRSTPLPARPSSSACRRPRRSIEGRTPAARYNEYNIERAGNGWRVEMVGRAAGSNDQVWECERRVLRER